MNRQYAAVAERARRRCEYCRAPEQVFNFAFDVEHIVPRATGGNDDLANLALACESCNTYKSTATSEIDPLTAASVRLFHPRSDEWIHNFYFDFETASIIGQTDVGRATIVRLRMNAAFQIRARLQWMTLDLYP